MASIVSVRDMLHDGHHGCSVPPQSVEARGRTPKHNSYKTTVRWMSPEAVWIHTATRCETRLQESAKNEETVRQI